MNAKLRRVQRLKTAQDFQRLNEDPVQKTVTEFFILKKIPNKLGYSRIGIITSKKVGHAYQRNRARRIIREIFRTKIQNYYGTYDFLVIVRSALLKAKFQDICDRFISAIQNSKEISVSVNDSQNNQKANLYSEEKTHNIVYRVSSKIDICFKHIAVFLIKCYQRILSPIKFYIFGPDCRCRFHPTCSQYAIEMYKSHNFFKATFLVVKRILKCNPFNKNIDNEQ